MREYTRRLSRTAAGFTRAAGILLVLVVVLAAIAVVPLIRRDYEQKAAFNCSLSVAKMQDLVDIEVLFRQESMTVQEVRDLLADYQARGEILCPSGGEFEVEDDGSLSKEVFCCCHDSNGVRRVLYNARHCLDRVRKEVQKAQVSGTAFPESVRVTLNGKTLKANLVREATGLRRGTATTSGYRGTVAFYALAGENSGDDRETAIAAGSADTTAAAGSADRLDSSDSIENSDSADSADRSDSSDNSSSDSSASSDSSDKALDDSFFPDGKAETGEVWYFSFADEDHAATWTVGGGWRIDRR